ncbi:MAG: SIR2 family protein [Bacteroidetes bacterium]|nr:SIR2 family protein [Bacteroidota bacterium]
MSDISFLIGSGFSIPYGFPSTSFLNEKLGKIDANEISIHSSGDARFLNGQPDPNANWSRVEERKFIQSLLEYYNENILKDGEGFNYEEFYDYYKEMLKNEIYDEDFTLFVNAFMKANNYEYPIHQLLFQFNLSYNQLLSQLIWKDIERCHLCKPYHSSHSAFLNLVEHYAKDNIIHIHSLNHDLYIEHLAYSDSIQANLDDGFEEYGSPFYGELFNKYERYKARLEYFTNKYESKFRLYKLHGSINHYWFQGDGELEMIKIKRGVGKTDLLKEVIIDGKYEYKSDTSNYYPDFLSGKLTKIDQYAKGSYYPIMFSHFQNNLTKSNVLVIIGYGFGDEQINKYLEAYINTESKKILVVDIVRPLNTLLEKANVFYIEGGVVGMDINAIISNN